MIKALNEIYFRKNIYFSMYRTSDVVKSAVTIEITLMPVSKQQTVVNGYHFMLMITQPAEIVA